MITSPAVARPGLQLDSLFAHLQSEIDELRASLMKFGQEAALGRGETSQAGETVSILASSIEQLQLDHTDLRSALETALNSNAEKHLEQEEETAELLEIAVKNVREHTQAWCSARLSNLDSSMATLQTESRQRTDDVQDELLKALQKLVERINKADESSVFWVNDVSHRLEHITHSIVPDIYGKLEKERAEYDARFLRLEGLLELSAADSSSLRLRLDEAENEVSLLTKRLTEMKVSSDQSSHTLAIHLQNLGDSVTRLTNERHVTERNNEALQTWVKKQLQNLRTQLLSQQEEGGGGGGGGIGVSKCLVCNQATTMKTREETVPIADSFLVKIATQRRADVDEETGARGRRSPTSPSATARHPRRKLASLLSPFEMGLQQEIFLAQQQLITPALNENPNQPPSPTNRALNFVSYPPNVHQQSPKGSRRPKSATSRRS